jgi:adenylate cyclase
LPLGNASLAYWKVAEPEWNPPLVIALAAGGRIYADATTPHILTIKYEVWRQWSDLAMTRKLTTILATDVAGFSRLMDRDEETTLASLYACRDILSTLVDRHGGRVFGSAGDGFVAEFASTVEAVQCAVDFQQQIEQRNSSVSEVEQLTFRAGVSIGDVVVNDSNLYGHGVHEAVRIESLADPGGILVTAETF